jgi:hypothetical protein
MGISSNRIIMNIEQLTESPAYQAWVHSQEEPEEKLFVGKPPAPKDLPGWMTRGADYGEPIPGPVMDDEYLKRVGII